MRKERFSVLLLAALALASGALAWWLRGLGEDRAARALDVPALARPLAPEQVIRVGAAPLADLPGLARSTAGAPEAGLAVDPSSAVRIEGRLVLPPGTPNDETPRVLAVSFGAEQAGRIEAWRKGLASSRGSSASSSVAGEVPCELAPDGRFSALVHPAATRALVWLEARYLFLDQPVEIDLEGRRVELRPELGAWLTGRFEPPAGVEPEPFREPFEVRLRTWSPLGVGVRLIRSTEVDEALSFEFRGVRTDLDHSLMADPGTLAAVTELSIELAPGEHRDQVWPLQRGVAFEGLVLGPGGAPLEGALVRADTSGLPHVVRPERATTTDGAGRFALEAVSPGTVTLYAEHPTCRGAAVHRAEVADGERVADLVLRLESGSVVSGRVAWPQGGPAAGALVTVTEELPPSLLTRGYDRRDHRATADGAGRFTLGGLGPGPFVVRARAEGPPASGSDGTPLAGGGPAWTAELAQVPPDSQLELRLRAPIAVSGRVVDERLEPVTAFDLRVAEVRREGAGEGTYGEELHALRDPDGVFHLDGLGPGTWNLSASAEGHAGPVSVVVTLPDQPGPFLLELPRAGRVSGRVVDPNGAPVAGVEVDFDPLEAPRPWHVRAARTDLAGRFELGPLPPGPVELQALLEGWAPSFAQRFQVPAGGELTDLCLELRAPGRLTGEVYRADGSPDSGRELFVLTGVDQQGELARVDERGHFVVEDLATGEHLVVPIDEPDDRDPTPVQPVTVTINAGETTHVVLGQPSALAVRLRGRVLQAEIGVGGATLLAFRAYAPAAAVPGQATTAADGAFALTLEGPGQHLLVVSAPDGARSEFPVSVPPTSEHRLDLDLPGGRISGTVRGPDGAPLGGVPVSCSSEDGARGHEGLGPGVFSADDGSYLLGGLRPGSYTLRAGGSGVGVALRPGVELAQGGSLEVDLELPRTGTIVGTVRDEDGEPFAGAAVFVRAASGALLNPATRTLTDADGRFEFSGCAPGDYTVSAHAGESATQESEPLPVGEGAAIAVELLLEPGARLSVAAEQGGARVPAAVRVEDSAGRDVASMEGGAGAGALLTGGLYRPERVVGPLPPGTYTVTATHGEASTSRSVTVAGTGTVELTLTLD